MEREQEILAFLKALFAGEPLEGVTFTRLPAEKSLQVLVYYYCRKQLPEDCRETAQKAYYSFAISEMRRRATGEKIRSVLDEAGIPFYFLKGCELAYAYYPDPALRFSIDVDFLTGENDALPAVPQQEYRQMLAQCDVGMITLHHAHKTQNIPGKLLGYMSLKKPVLASVNAGNDLLQIIPEYQAGLVSVNPDDAALFTHAAAMLDAAKRQQMGEGAYRLLQNKFDVEKIAAEIVAAMTC